MFKVIAQKDSLSSQEQKKLLQQIRDKAELNPSAFSKELQQYQANQKVTTFFQKFPLESIQSLIKSLSVQQCLDFMEDKLQGQQHANLRTLVKVTRNLPKNKFIQALLLHQHIASIQKQLVIIRLTAGNLIKGATVQMIHQILPQFIRLQAFIIEKYLKLKNQSSNTAEDYIQNDYKIVKKCEFWLADALKAMFESLPNLQGCNSEIRKSVMICLGDLYAALLQGIRQDNLKSEILEGIIKEEDNYFQNNFTIQQIRKSFMNNLQVNGFQNPNVKLLIKETYSADMPFNTVAFCYLCLQAARNAAYDCKFKLSLLMPAFSQIASRPYEFKKDIIRQIKTILQGQVFHILSGYEWNYPIQLILFNAFIHEPNFYNQLLGLLIFTDKRVTLNSLIDLRKIRIQNYEVQKESYIVQRIQNERLWQDKRSLILYKMLNFNGTNQKLHEELILSLEKYYLTHKSLDSTKELFIERILTNVKAYPKVAEKLKLIMTG